MIELNLRTFCSSVQRNIDDKDVSACTKALFDINVLLELLQSKKAKVVAILEDGKMSKETEPVHFNDSGLQLDRIHNVVFERMEYKHISYTLYFSFNNKRFYVTRPKKKLDPTNPKHVAALNANRYLFYHCNYNYNYDCDNIYEAMDALCGSIVNKKVQIKVSVRRNPQTKMVEGLNCNFVGSWV